MEGVHINGGELERYGMTLGYKGETVDRRLRELHASGQIKGEERMGKEVSSMWFWVEIKPPQIVERDGVHIAMF